MAQPIVRHSDEDRELLVKRVRLQQRLESCDCLLILTGFEQRQSKIQTQAGHSWVESNGSSVTPDCLFIAPLLRLDQPEVGKRFSFRRKLPRQTAPGPLSLNEFALALQ